MNMKNIVRLFLTVVFGIASSFFAFGDDNPFQPNQSVLPTLPPEGAVVLFAGNSAEQFVGKGGTAVDWPVQDGTLVSKAKDERSNHILSKLHFRDADIHVEFKMTDQARGNSGIYIHGHYEIQIIDSVGNDPLTYQDMGALYGIHAPKVAAGFGPDVWQVYDIRYRAPRRSADGKIVQKGVVSAWLNGKQVLDRVEFEEPASAYHPYRYKATPYLKKIEERLLKTGVGPLFLQDHDNPCRFRNVWVMPLDSDAFFYGKTDDPYPVTE